MRSTMEPIDPKSVQHQAWDKARKILLVKGKPYAAVELEPGGRKVVSVRVKGELRARVAGASAASWVAARRLAESHTTIDLAEGGGAQGSLRQEALRANRALQAMP